MSTDCRVPDCGRAIHLKRDALCQAHYNQQRRGETLRPIRPKRPNGALTDRDELGRKWCSGGNHWLSTDRFAVNRSAPDGLQAACKECRAQLYYQAQKASILEKRRVYLFGLDDAAFAAMLAEQGGECAACGTTRGPWHIDHDHICCPGSKTCGNCVRAILCASCNCALGFAKDNPATLRALADYLERHGV
jgi:hypothetical protein